MKGGKAISLIIRLQLAGIILIVTQKEVENNFEVSSSSIGSDYDFAKFSFTTVNRNSLGKFQLNTCVFAQYEGSNWAMESQLYLAGANPEALMDNKFTRAQGFIPNDWLLRKYH